MIKVICTLSFILLVGPLRAQDKNVTKGNQQWLHFYNQTKLSDEWSLLIDGGFRWKQDLLKRSQYLIRAAGGYNIIPGIRVAVGLTHLGTYTEVDITTVEFRPYQELSVKSVLGVLGLNQRLRIEQRLIEATRNNDQQTDRFNWRFRYFIGLSVPIVKQFRNHPEMELNLNIGDEIFINAGKDIVYNIFDQNRILIGPAFKLNDQLSFTLTYNGKYSALNLPSEFTYNHIVWLAIRHNLDLTKSVIE